MQSLSGPHGRGLLGSHSQAVTLLTFSSRVLTFPTGLFLFIFTKGGGFKLLIVSASRFNLYSIKL